MEKNVRPKSSASGLVALLGVLGFASSCDKNDGGSGNNREEYGVPTAEY